MFMRKEQAAVKTTEKRVVYKKFSLLKEGADESGSSGFASGSGSSGSGARSGKSKTLYGVSGENCEISGGGIRPWLGVKKYKIGGSVIAAPLDTPLGVSKIALIPYVDSSGVAREFVVYVTKKGGVFSCDAGDTTYTIEDAEFPAGKVSVLPWTESDGKQKLVFCGENGVYLFDREEKFDLLCSGATGAACVFHERIFFGAAGGRLRFCAPLDTDAWADDADESGYVDFPKERGEIVGIAALKERLYVFFERGIARVDARGSARNFTAENVDYSGGEIFFGSVGTFGGKVLFLTADGLFSFDGNKAEKICFGLPIEPKRTGQVCNHAVFSGKFYLDYIDADGGAKRLAVDGKTGEGFFMTTKPTGISATEGKLLCYHDSSVCEFATGEALPTGESFAVKKDYYDFGIRGRKLLKSVAFKGKGRLRAEVSNGYERHGYTFTIADGESSVVPLVKGEKFSLKISPEVGCEVLAVELTFAVYG